MKLGGNSNGRVAASKGVPFSKNPVLAVRLPVWRSRVVLFLLFFAFAGLGVMGAPMARNLAAAGHRVVALGEVVSPAAATAVATRSSAASASSSSTPARVLPWISAALDSSRPPKSRKRFSWPPSRTVSRFSDRRSQQSKPSRRKAATIFPVAAFFPVRPKDSAQATRTAGAICTTQCFVGSFTAA